MSGYQDPFSVRAEGIAHQAIRRADTLGMEHYGPAPAPLDETRDMIREAIEELQDGIYYLIRQVAKLEDLRTRIEGKGDSESDRPNGAAMKDESPPARAGLGA